MVNLYIICFFYPINFCFFCIVEREFRCYIFPRSASLLASVRMGYDLRGRGGLKFKEAICSKNCMKNAALSESITAITLFVMSPWVSTRFSTAVRKALASR